MVRFENELKCICCGATTKGYPFDKEDLDFLTFYAQIREILIKEATEEDIPLLQVLMQKLDYKKNQRKTLDPFSILEDGDLSEEYWLEDEAEISDLNREITKAHLLDSQKFDTKNIKVENPKYLSEENTKALLLEIEKELERIKKLNSRFKDLMIEECNTAKYEILILSGAHIPSLIEQLKDEANKIALTKAYYNISNI